MTFHIEQISAYFYVGIIIVFMGIVVKVLIEMILTPTGYAPELKGTRKSQIAMLWFLWYLASF